MSQYPAVIELSSLDGTNGFQINGAAAYDYGGQDALRQNTTDGGKLDHFNPEQQAQIFADFYLVLKASGDTTAFDPYIKEMLAA